MPQKKIKPPEVYWTFSSDRMKLPNEAVRINEDVGKLSKKREFRWQKLVLVPKV